MRAGAPNAGFVTLGFFPKRVAKRPSDWLLPENIDEICSVSECLSAGPKDWIDRWRHNDFFFYDSVAAAEEAAECDPADGFSIFAFRMLPRRFGKEDEGDIELPATSIELFPEAFVFLGFDVVSYVFGFESHPPGCSPLSCNAMSKEFRVNKYCLIDDYAEALECARRFGLEIDGVEPGPYFLFEVWRRFT